jgi:hypothetical protein
LQGATIGGDCVTAPDHVPGSCATTPALEWHHRPVGNTGGTGSSTRSHDGRQGARTACPSAHLGLSEEKLKNAIQILDDGVGYNRLVLGPPGRRCGDVALAASVMSRRRARVTPIDATVPATAPRRSPDLDPPERSPQVGRALLPGSCRMPPRRHELRRNQSHGGWLDTCHRTARRPGSLRVVAHVTINGGFER